MPLFCSPKGHRPQDTQKTQDTKRSARILTSPVQSFAPALEMELGGPPDGSGSPFEHM